MVRSDGFDVPRIGLAGTVDALTADPLIDASVIPAGDGVDGYIQISIAPRRHTAETVDIWLPFPAAEELRDQLNRLLPTNTPEEPVP